MVDVTKRSQKAVAYRVWVSRRTGEPTGPDAYGPYTDRLEMVAASVHERLAPDYARARCMLAFEKHHVDAWRWRELIARDDRILIASATPAAADSDVVFSGFIAEVEWGYGAGTEHCAVTACSPAFRLLVDVIVYGRYMRCPDGEIRHAGGLPCLFNAGGVPNRSTRRVNASGWQYDPPAFTADGDRQACWWSAADIFRYLTYWYNGRDAGATWIDNPAVLDLDWSNTEPVVAGCEGLGLWAAMAAVADKGGYDVAERVANDGSGCAAHSIRIVRRHAGTQRTVRKQEVDANGAFPELDLAQTNLFTARVGESVTSCVTRPIVAGGRYLYETTIELVPAWDPAGLTIASDQVVRPSRGEQIDLAESTFVSRYCVGGTEFRLYWDVGRLWDANTDGRYADAPYSQGSLDMADHLGLTAGAWPSMPYRPLPMLTRIQDHALARSAGSYAEFTIDGGTNWYPLANYRVLPRRVGLWISAANPAGILPPGEADPANNLFAKLIDSPANVKVRLTCTIEGPVRNIVSPARRSTAGTPFSQKAWFDRGAAGDVRVRSPSSRFHGSALPAHEQTVEQAEAELAAIARRIQDAAEDRLIEASLPIEWPDEPLYLTDQVTRIEGIEYDLATN
ncbi:MAG TPA: hypothetical protein VMZ50_03320, partial [Phycisphaerae bacterium]|nr:hypothetical protein [Phycisphaerae bacterium]